MSKAKLSVSMQHSPLTYVKRKKTPRNQNLHLYWGCGKVSVKKKLADSLVNHENQDTSAAKNRYCRV